MIDKQALLDQFPDNTAGEIDAVNMRNVINDTVDQINQNESDIVDGGDMDAAVYDPQTIEADAFARANHTGTQTLSTISDAGTAAASDSGDFDAAGTAAAGDSAHLSAFNHANLLTTDERAGFDAGTAINALNPPASINDLPSVVTDHGALSGLDDDDHTQYHTDARGDARYAQSTDNSVTNILTVTQAEYDGLTPDPTTLYLICG